jgi:hypothetical protein
MHTKATNEIYMQFGDGISKCPKFNEQQSSIVSMPTCDFRRRRMTGIKNGGDVVQLIKVYEQKNVRQKKGYA